jgi:Tfp pilus assembly protein PilF
VQRHSAACTFSLPYNNCLKNNKIDRFCCISRHCFFLAWWFFLVISFSFGSSAQTREDSAPQFVGDGRHTNSGVTASDGAAYAVSVHQLSISDKVLKHLESAHKQFSKRDLRGASVEVSRALEIDPDCAQAFTMRALIRMASKDFEGAVADAGHAVELDPNDALSFLALGTAYNSQDNFQLAETPTRQALTMRPDLWQARLELAKSFYGRQQFEAALRELDSPKTDFPDVHLVRGNILISLGRRKEGIAEFTVFLAEAPRDHRAERIKQIIVDTAPPQLGLTAQ